MHGVDFEPDLPFQRLQNITLINTSAFNNSGAGFGGYFANLYTSTSNNGTLSPLQLHFINCSINYGGVGWSFSTFEKDLYGFIRVEGGVTSATNGHSLGIYQKFDNKSMVVDFENHIIDNVATNGTVCNDTMKAKLCPPGSLNSPVALYVRAGNSANEGCVRLNNLTIRDNTALSRPWLQVIGNDYDWVDVNVSNINVHVRNQQNCDINTTNATISVEKVYCTTID
eukprot:m.18244 g.18244  ORF g.18244 m.18244 type:complete len:226 (+) comp6250_c0_seq1:179-856(+)